MPAVAWLKACAPNPSVASPFTASPAIVIHNGLSEAAFLQFAAGAR